MPRILCARFPHLGLVAVWRRHPELRHEPVVLEAGEPGRVAAASEAARGFGVRAGHPVRQARQLCPGAVLLPLPVAAVDELRSALLDALCSLAPAVELGDEEAWTDLSGRHAAHRDELAWAAAVARGLTEALAGAPGGRPRDVLPAVGLASTRQVAHVAARLAAPGRVRRVRPGEEAAILAALPVGMLPADPAILARLGDLGLDRVGQVAALSPADLQRQFGPAGLGLLRLARGETEEPLDPHRRPLVLVERAVLDGPVCDLEILRRCAERASGALGDQLLARGLVAARVELTLEPDGAAPAAGRGTVGTAPWSAGRVPPLPVGSAADLWPAVLALLGSVRPDGPVAALRLLAGGLGPAAARQTDLLRAGDAARDAVTVTVARLRDRFGGGTVLRPRLALDPGDLPERRFVWEIGAAEEPPARTRGAAAAAGSRGGELAAASMGELRAIPCPPTGIRPPTAGRRPVDPRDGEGPVSRVRRERPASDGSTGRQPTEIHAPAAAGRRA